MVDLHRFAIYGCLIILDLHSNRVAIYFEVDIMLQVLPSQSSFACCK